MKDEKSLPPSAISLHPADLMLVASFGDPTAADYANRVADGKSQIADLSQESAIVNLQSALGAAQVSAVVVFLKPRLSDTERDALDKLIETAAHANFIAIVSTFQVHLGDENAAQTEAYVLERLKRLSGRVVVVRAGHILSPHSRASTWLRRLGFCYPLVPARLRSCCVDGAQLFAAIDSERRATHARRIRIFTLLGPNQPWKDRLREHRANSLWQNSFSLVCILLSLLLVGQLAGLLLDLLARCWPSLGRWNFDTVKPRNFRELLALCNRHNFPFVKVVGYNNGVVHFGQHFPGKTVVSTVFCKRIVRAGANVVKADGGATIRKAMDFLATTDQELYVIPNYSYVCLGTAFFVPIHGSAADFTTVAETITKVLLYDCASDRLILATSDEPAFRDHVYNMQSSALLLRLWIRVKPRARYFVHKQERENATSAELLDALRDSQATNVEIRKSNASSGKVEISKYYKAAADGGDGPALEIPRDSLGRLWDRLEENAVTSFLMHALTRWLAWHVELLFTAEEFATFWKTHQTVPLKKIQVRYIRRDGLPHSPFCAHDCVSVDLFLFRWNRQKFEAYLKKTFTVIRSNPGKHSG